ncbi:hypothetical protein Q3G72_000432 [Acer saccharum]|nr:hypothetical protein Q3G72_000432 [Acer saccharum]
MIQLDRVLYITVIVHTSHVDWGFLIGAAAHAAIMIIDYDPTTRYNDLLDHVLRHRNAIISHITSQQGPDWSYFMLQLHACCHSLSIPTGVWW